MYGYGTLSHLRSPEYQQMKRERAEATAAYERGEIRFGPVEVPVMCRCPQRPWPHELAVHEHLRFDWAAWGAGQSKMAWPWTLRFVTE